MTPKSTVWQVSGGPLDRPYAELFTEHGVVLIGPGESGPAHHTSPQPRFVRVIAAEMRLGDLLLLRSGARTVVAVGVVAGDYVYLEQFDDVNGWDLRHGRRVRWGRLPEAYTFDRAVFGANPPRLARVNDPEAVAFAERFAKSGLTGWKEVPLPNLPPPEASLAEVPAHLRDLIGLAQDLAWLYTDPNRIGDLPAESEMVAHFVVPFLRALGWAPELIAVEWRRVDVAVFACLPRTPESCEFVVEAKRLGNGLEPARQQARDYVEQLGIDRSLVVTDGLRYRAFDFQNDYAPTAYANLAKPKESAMKLFTLLSKERSERENENGA